MKRQLRLTGCLLIASCLLTISPVLSARAAEVVLADDQLSIAFDADSGALTRLEDKTAHWTIERRSELGVSFRLHAPLPNRRDNFVLGQKQRAASVTKISDHQVRLEWKELVSEHGGVLPMVFTATVTLTNGALTFAGVLADNSSLPVETIDYPYLGDFNPPARNSSLMARYGRTGKNGGLQSDEIYPHFGNEKGYWGVFYPLKTLESQRDLCCLIQAPADGVCVAMDVAKLPYRLQYTFEQHPGVLSSINNLVPPQDEIGGVPVHLEFRTCHFIFAGPHSTTSLAPVVLGCYHGGWQAGVARYKQLRAASAGP